MGHGQLFYHNEFLDFATAPTIEAYLAEKNRYCKEVFAST
jgi:hypothetical protein